MRSRFGGRSTETPMDFEFTSRPTSSARPVWAAAGDDPSTPKKRSLHDANPPTPGFPAPPHSPAYPTFGSSSNVPFLFQQPPPQSPHKPAWEPPANFSAEKAFPQPEVDDVDMSELSPPKPSASPATERAADGERAVAVGAMRRVFRSRQRARERSLLGRGKSGRHEDDSDAYDDSDEEGRMTPVTQNLSNHYTLNVPTPAPPPSDLPYVLLGYLQFFFNLSLILVFLYLLVQFILTVQRDVEHRISEYSMDVVQEIAQCTTQYKVNMCATRPVPAMAHQCGVWEACMNRDPSKVGRAKVGAELIAEVVNGFVEPISWKTLIFTLTSLSFLTLFINTLLSLYRARHNPSSHPNTAHPPPPVPHFPHTPVVPYVHPQNYFTSAPEWKAWNPAEREEVQTPSRRRRLEGGAVAKIQ